jgi:HSP20 family protein
MARNPLYPFATGGLGRSYGDPFMSLHREMNRLFDDAFRGMAPPGQGGQSGQGRQMMPSGQHDLGQTAVGQGGFAQVALVPHMDVSETDTDLRISAELPGVVEDDVEVTLNDDVLTIRGEKKFERADERENYHFVERSYGLSSAPFASPIPSSLKRCRQALSAASSLSPCQRQSRSRRAAVSRCGAVVARAEAARPSAEPPLSRAEAAAALREVIAAARAPAADDGLGRRSVDGDMRPRLRYGGPTGASADKSRPPFLAIALIRAGRMLPRPSPAR